jgi:hypothetical protein
MVLGLEIAAIPTVAGRDCHRGSDLRTAKNCQSLMSQSHGRKAKPSP